VHLNLLQQSINQFQKELFNAISTATYNGTSYENGQKAKEALIRSQSLIFNVHESVKVSLSSSLKNLTKYDWTVYPPINASSPELKIYGKIKGKDQDLVFLRHEKSPIVIEDGPNIGQIDEVGLSATKTSIIVGIRSQMSSIDKNFDTLMERAFAETLNLRLRAPIITMGEVYVLPLEELDDREMLKNRIAFSNKKVNIQKFIKTFHSFTSRASLKLEDQYKYDASALVLIDLTQSPPKIIFNENDLREYAVDENICTMYKNICAEGFNDRLINNYLRFQKESNL